MTSRGSRHGKEGCFLLPGLYLPEVWREGCPPLSPSYVCFSIPAVAVASLSSRGLAGKVSPGPGAGEPGSALGLLAPFSIFQKQVPSTRRNSGVERCRVSGGWPSSWVPP